MLVVLDVLITIGIYLDSINIFTKYVLQYFSVISSRLTTMAKCCKISSTSFNLKKAFKNCLSDQTCWDLTFHTICSALVPYSKLIILSNITFHASDP